MHVASLRAAAAVFAGLAGVASVGLAGCKDDAIAALETTRDRVCECTSAACVNAAMNELRDLPTKQQRKAEAVAREITECVARIYRTSDAREAEPAPEPGDGSGTGGSGRDGDGSATGP